MARKRDEDHENSVGGDTGSEHAGADDAESLHDILSDAYDASPAGEHIDETRDAPKSDGGEPQTRPSEGDTKPAGGETKLEPMEAPANWSAADREMFGKIPPAGQKWLFDRYKGMEAAHTQRSQEVAPLRQFNERWDPYFKQLGTPAPQALDLLMQTEYQLRTGSNDTKVQILKKLINDYGIAGPGGGGAPAVSPEVAALQQQIGAMQNGFAQQNHHAAQAREGQLMGYVQAFETEKDADGKLAHPFYGEVRADMARAAMGRGIDGSAT